MITIDRAEYIRALLRKEFDSNPIDATESTYQAIAMAEYLGFTELAEEMKGDLDSIELGEYEFLEIKVVG